MTVHTLTKRYSGKNTAKKARREIGELADVVYISEGTPNDRFQRLDATGWMEVPDLKTARKMLAEQKRGKGRPETGLFIRTSGKSGRQRIYIAAGEFRKFEGKDITDQI